MNIWMYRLEVKKVLNEMISYYTNNSKYFISKAISNLHLCIFSKLQELNNDNSKLFITYLMHNVDYTSENKSNWFKTLQHYSIKKNIASNLYKL